MHFGTSRARMPFYCFIFLVKIKYVWFFFISGGDVRRAARLVLSNATARCRWRTARAGDPPRARSIAGLHLHQIKINVQMFFTNKDAREAPLFKHLE
jgi:hypothetical protein